MSFNVRGVRDLGLFVLVDQCSKRLKIVDPKGKYQKCHFVALAFLGAHPIVGPALNYIWVGSLEQVLQSLNHDDQDKWEKRDWVDTQISIAQITGGISASLAIASSTLSPFSMLATVGCYYRAIKVCQTAKNLEIAWLYREDEASLRVRSFPSITYYVAQIFRNTVPGMGLYSYILSTADGKEWTKERSSHKEAMHTGHLSDSLKDRIFEKHLKDTLCVVIGTVCQIIGSMVVLTWRRHFSVELDATLNRYGLPQRNLFYLIIAMTGFLFVVASTNRENATMLKNYRTY